MMKKKLEVELLVVMEHAGSMKAEMAGGNLINATTKTLRKFTKNKKVLQEQSF